MVLDQISSHHVKVRNRLQLAISSKKRRRKLHIGLLNELEFPVLGGYRELILVPQQDSENTVEVGVQFFSVLTE